MTLPLTTERDAAADGPSLLTVPDIVDLAGVSRSLVHKWVLAGHLPFETTRRGVRIFRREDVDAWLADWRGRLYDRRNRRIGGR